jgi:hypothetical protein
MSEPTSKITEVIDPALLDGREGISVTIGESATENKWEVPTYLRSCFDLDLNRFVPNTIPMTLERFIEVAGLVIEDAQDREGVPESERVLLIEDYPAEQMERLGDTVIVWKLKDRRPARMSADGKSRSQPGYTYDYSFRSPTNPNMILEVEGRPIDHQIEFAIWSKYARMANEKALWLERLFVNHKWAFTIQGADRFIWTGRGIDTYQTTNGQRLYIRPLTFSVRLRDFRIKADPIIKQFLIDIETTTEGQLRAGAIIDSISQEG